MTRRERLEAELSLALETVRYYGENPQARRSFTKDPTTDRTVCCYVSDKDTSDGCAIGRLLTQEEREKFPMKYNTLNLVDIDEVYLPQKAQSLLREPRMGWSRFSFLRKLQELHDSPENWFVDKGLTTTGTKQLSGILANCYQYAEILVSWERIDNEIDKLVEEGLAVRPSN